MSKPSSWFRRLPLNRAQRRAAVRSGPTEFRPAVTRLEDRSTPATITTSGQSAFITLDTDDEVVTFNTATAGEIIVASNKTITVNGTTETSPYTLTGRNFIEVTDGAANVSVVFADSTVDYAAGFDIELDDTPAGVTFNGDSSFGVRDLSVYVAGRIVVSSAATITSTNGTIDLDANHLLSTGAGVFNGLEVIGTVTSSGTGTIYLYGRGGDEGGKGVVISNAVTASGTGNIFIDGIGGTDGTNNNHGVEITGTAGVVSTTSSNISIDGFGGDGGNSSTGVLVTAGASVAAGGFGSVSISGTGGATDDANNAGVRVTGAGSLVTVAGGDASVDGTGGGDSLSGGGNDGVELTDGGKITTTAIEGRIFVTGTGGTGGEGNVGVNITGTGSEAATVGGHLFVSGVGGDGEDFNHGVFLVGGGRAFADGTGDVEVQGTGGTGGDDNIGVLLSGSTSAISTAGGDVVVSGTGGSGTSDNHGILVEDAAVITAGGDGEISVTGQGGLTGEGNIGVAVIDNGTVIRTANGNISVTGTGGNGGGTGSHGIQTSGRAEIEVAGGSGTISLTGTGGSAGTTNHGVLIGVGSFGLNETRVRTNNAGLTITGTGTGGGHGLRVGSDGRLRSGGIGDLLIASDTVSVNGNARLQAGTSGLRRITFRPLTAGTAVAIGGTDVTTGSTLTLGLSDSELDTIFSTTLLIGSESTGDISVVDSVDLADSNNVRLVSGGNIAFTGGGFDTGGGSLIVTPGTDASEGVSAAFSGIDATTNSLQFANGSDVKVAIDGTTVETEYNQIAVLGNINLTGADLVLSGSYTPANGDTFDIVTASTVSGTFKGLPDGTLFTYKGVSMRIVYGTSSVTLVANNLPTNVSTGGPYTVGEGEPLTLTASATDADGDTLQYTWDVNGDGVFGDEAEGSTPDFGKTLTFTAAQLAELGLDNGPRTVSTLRVRANDGGGWVDSPDSTLAITNTPPTASAFAGSTSALEGQTVGFGGSFTDPVLDGPYTYTWTATLNGKVVGGVSGGVPTTGPDAGLVPGFVFTAPDNGTFLISLVITDKDGGASAPAVASLVVGNVAPTLAAFVVPSVGVAGEAIGVSAIAADAAGTFDPLTYAWTVLKNGSLFSTGVGPNIAFIPDGIGAYTVSLLVTDGDGGSVNATQTVLVSASAAPPPGAALKVATARYAASYAGAVFVVTPADGSVQAFVPFPGLTGEISTALGDLNGDGLPELVVGAGAGAAPHVKAYDLASGAEVLSFFAYDPRVTTGVFVAADGGRIAVGTGAGSAPHVRVLDAAGNELQSFFAYNQNMITGVRVALGDLDGDGVPEVVTGTGAGSAPHVKAFGGVSGAEVASFFAYDPRVTTGVFVAAGGGRIAVGTGAGGAPHVKVFDATLGMGETNSFFAYNTGNTGGVRVALADVDADGDLDLLTGTGPGAAPHVRGFTLPDLTEVVSFFPVDPANPIPFVPTRGVFVA